MFKLLLLLQFPLCIPWQVKQRFGAYMITLSGPIKVYHQLVRRKLKEVKLLCVKQYP